MVIILGFDQRTCLMCWVHAAHMICASKFKGSYVLRNPAFAHAVDFMTTENASPTRCFPHFQTSVWRKLSASGGSYIFNIDEGHSTSLGRAMRRGASIPCAIFNNVPYAMK
jgi:hypothetical protein